MLERMKKARSGLIVGEPFFGTLSMKLDLREDAKTKTSWTDGKTLGFNADWVRDTPMPELEATVAHHVLSCAWGHHLRRGTREFDLWQEASDHVVNLELKRAGFTLPAGSLCDPQFDAKTVEQVYGILKKQQEEENDGDDQNDGGGEGQGGSGSGQPGQSDGQGDGDADEGQGDFDAPTGTCRDATDDSGEAKADDAERAEQMQEWKEAAAEAAQIAKGAGRMPGGIARGVEDFLTSKVDWREQLQRLLRAKSRDDSSFMRPSRTSPPGFVLPGRYSEACGPLAFFVDASGSITEHELQQAVSEIEEARAMMQPERVIVYVFDVKVRARYVFEKGEQITGVKVLAGGGTAFDDPIYELEREGITPEVAVFLTDLDSHVFADEPHYPVVWISTLKDTAPYGDVVLMKG